MSIALLVFALAASTAPPPPCPAGLIASEAKRYRKEAERSDQPGPRPELVDELAAECAGGKARACGTLALVARSKRLEACAQRRLEADCKGGSGEDCFELAGLLRRGLNRTPQILQRADRERDRGRTLLEKSCLGGSEVDCSSLANHLAASPLRPDEKRTLEVLCDHGEGRACEVAANEAGEGKVPLLEKACAARVPSATACDLLSRWYQAGETVAVDLPRAATLRRRACALDPPNCRGDVPICGNGQIEHGFTSLCPPCMPGRRCHCTRVPVALEECDGAAIPTTCDSLGHAGGTLRCTAECKLDPSGCLRKAPLPH